MSGLFTREEAVAAGTEVTRGQITAENLTDEQIRAALDALPSDHYSRQWYVDALGSEHHQRRRANARRAVAELLNSAGAEARRKNRIADDEAERATAAPGLPTRTP